MYIDSKLKSQRFYSKLEKVQETDEHLANFTKFLNKLAFILTFQT